MKFIVLDSESDDLWENATKIHVLSWTENGEDYHSTFDYGEMKSLLETPDTMFVCHNAIRHDLPLFNKILGTNLNYKNFVDSLALSWYINHKRVRHGIESYGPDYGLEKPKITDWENLTPEEYAHRCEEDVKINWCLWQDLHKSLLKLYENNHDEVLRIINYLGFKMDCYREAELYPVYLDVEKAQEYHDKLKEMKEEAAAKLSAAMPVVQVFKPINKPSLMVKKDGSISKKGEEWYALLKELKLPETTIGPVQILDSEFPGNPDSDPQIKDWLFGMGWKPKTLKYTKNKETGQEKKIPQVRKDGELCESVRELIQINPAVEILDGYTVITHRLSIFSNFLKYQVDGKIKARIDGFTNTLRFKHANPLVNLPGVDKPWGKEIRGVLLPPPGYVWCGSDMVSLESNTKRHYMKPLDPDYVEEMSQPGFDEHLDLAKFAGKVTEEDIAKHTSGEINLKPIRKKYKAANYSAIYGVGAPRLAREIGVTREEAQELLDAYWQRNWSIKKVAEQQKVKLALGGMWLQNPVSGFWHSLRAEKDRFSTLNQSTGVYCFDTWLAFCRAAGGVVSAQFHDEQLSPTKIGREDRQRDIFKRAIQRVNDKLKLNIDLDVDVQFGKNYAEVH